MKLTYLILPVFILCSCRFLETTESLSLQLPDRSDNLFEGTVLSWELSGCTDSGKITVKTYSNDIEKIVLATEKGLPSFYTLQARVLFRDTVFETKPAGFIYPYDCTSAGRGSFSWKRGFLSLLLAEAGDYMDTSRINISRLIESTESASEGADSWDIDGQQMLEELIAGDFSVYDIRLQRERLLQLTISSGIWMNNRPGAPDILADPSNPVTEVQLRTGNHKYISKEGQILEIFLYGDGKYDYLLY